MGKTAAELVVLVGAATDGVGFSGVRNGEGGREEAVAVHKWVLISFLLLLPSSCPPIPNSRFLAVGSGETGAWGRTKKSEIHR